MRRLVLFAAVCGLALIAPVSGQAPPSYTKDHFVTDTTTHGAYKPGYNGNIIWTQRAVSTYSGTGNGTISAITPGANVEIGAYTIRCKTAVADGGVFSVTSQFGTVLPDFTMTPGAGGTTAYTSSHLNFSITDGSTDFAVNATFTVRFTRWICPGNVGSTVTVNTIEAFCRYGTDATKHIRVALYNEDGTLAAYTGSVLVDNADLAWKGGSATGTLVGGNAYLLAVFIENLDTYIASNNAGGNWTAYKTNQTYANGFPASLPAQTGVTARNLAVRANLTYEVTDPRSASPTVCDAWLHLEAGNNADVLTTTIADAGHQGVALTSGVSATPMTGMTVATAGETVLPGALTVNGNAASDASGTRGWAFDHTQSAKWVTYALASAVSRMSVGFYLTMGVPVGNNNSQDYFYIQADHLQSTDTFAVNVSTNNYIINEVPSNRMQVETVVNSVTNWGSFFRIEPARRYWCSLLWDAVAGTATLRLYDSFDWSLVGESTAPLSTDAADYPKELRIGLLVAGATLAATSYWDDVLIDVTDATFPLLPSSGGAASPKRRPRLIIPR